MKTIKAVLSLPFGIVLALITWVIGLFYLLFTIPIEIYNNILYGKKAKSPLVKIVSVNANKNKNGDIEITLPNGEKRVIKNNNSGGQQNGDKKDNDQKNS